MFRCSQIAARQFPVTVHFSRRTEMNDYVGEAFSKVVKIHSRLPDGGVLVFLTGKQEIEDLVARVQRRFGKPKRKRKPAKAAKAAAAAAGASQEGDKGKDESKGSGDGDGDSGSDGSSDEEEEHRPVHVLPLYAMLPRKAQRAVFKPPPEGHRLIVVATNVAETSVTIPGIRYVVDTGRVKRRVYNTRAGTSKFEVGWVSQASADRVRTSVRCDAQTPPSLAQRSDPRALPRPCSELAERVVRGPVIATGCTRQLCMARSSPSSRRRRCSPNPSVRVGL